MTKSSIKAFLRNMLPRQVKTHRILAGPLRGHKMVTSWHRNFSGLTGRTEPGVNSWFAKNAHAGETWLDIGANYGCTALRLADLVGPMGRVFAFEPKLDTCGNLAETVAVNRMAQIVVVPVALGSNEDLDVRRFATSGSMAVGTDLADGPPETLMVARLDWLWPRIAGGHSPIHGVKIDVQGMELEVMRHGCAWNCTPASIATSFSICSKGAVIPGMGLRLPMGVIASRSRCIWTTRVTRSPHCRRVLLRTRRWPRGTARIILRPSSRRFPVGKIQKKRFLCRRDWCV
jgi:FkbM family methyltransferase